MDDSGLQVNLPYEEFEEDLEQRLGRANGNIFHRRPGIEGVHDGQYMVRLKKKRFIIIDYSIVPSDVDIQFANQNPHVSCPPGAGKSKCVTSECQKVGVPVLLYDSEPTEPSSLYLRAGLCFICQRNLNEKRRTQRKRPNSDAHKNSSGGGGGGGVLYSSGSGNKKVKLNGDVIELMSDAIVLNGPPSPDLKSAKHGNGFHEIGIDLSTMIHQATNETDHLLHSVSGGADTDVAVAAAVAAGVNTDATNAAVSMLNGDHHHHHVASHPPSSADVSAIYEKAFSSLSKSLYLLREWKHSWDAAIAAAVAHESNVGDPSLAEAVASAAAVAAAASSDAGQETSMQSLLHAADQRKDGGGVKQETEVETFEV